MAVTASQNNLAGLPRRLVQDGIISEESLLEASDAAKKERLPLVAYLVNHDLANARAIAVAASHEFGVPLLNLDAVEIDLDVVRSVDQKLINKHRVLPLVKRGQRLFLGISDPTNLQAIDDIKFQTSLRIDPVVIEQDKLEEQIVKAIEAVDTSMSGMDDDDFDLFLAADVSRGVPDPAMRFRLEFQRGIAHAQLVDVDHSDPGSLLDQTPGQSLPGLVEGGRLFG